ncbi:MAG: hypothetical protein MSG78_06790 [Clostridiales bacterium]|nr:hypothetical protein [Clostridiales bacterium]
MKKKYSELDRYYEYIEGNTIRKSEQVWEPQHEEEERRRQERRKRHALERQIEKERKQSRAFTLVQTGLLTVALAGFLVCTKNYIQVKSELNENNRMSASLQQKVQELQEENDERQIAIESSIDYDAIREYAMNNLGMVYPKKSQVLTYDGVESEYVRQNAEIPKE